MSCLIPTKPGGSLSGPPPTIGTTFGFPGDTAPVGEVYVYFHALDLQAWFDSLSKETITHQCFHSFPALMRAVMDTKPNILVVDRADSLISLLSWFPDLGRDCAVLLIRDILPQDFRPHYPIKVYAGADPYQLYG